MTNTLTMGRKGRRGTCDGGGRRAHKRHSKCWTREHADVSAVAHHEGDLLARLRLPADQKYANAEEEEAHGQQHQGPHLCSKDRADVVRGDVAEHAHDYHCGAGVKS